MKWLWQLGLTLMAASLPAATPVVSPSPASAEAEGAALARDLRTAPPPENLAVDGRLRLRAANGQRINVPFRYRVVTGNGTWQFVYETSAAEAGPGRKLVVTCGPELPPRYLLTSATNDPGHTLSGEEAMIPFAGSDFWLADLGLDFLHWPEQRIDRNTRLTMRKGRACKVLESVNPRPGAIGYTRVRSWVDLKTQGILIAEAYDGNRKLFKEFEVGGFTKVEGQWELKNMEMRNLRSDTRTVLEFHYEGRE
jgi:hypothetical protein